MEIQVGARTLVVTVDSGAARTVGNAKQLAALRADNLTAASFFERLGATNPRRCQVASEGAPHLEVGTVQLLNLVVKGYELEDLGVRGGVRVTTHAKEGLLEAKRPGWPRTSSWGTPRS